MGNVRNQYSDIITYDRFFKPYKNAVSEEEKSKIAQEMLQVIRSINTFPVTEFDLAREMDELRSLTNTKTDRVYNYEKGEIGFGSAGLGVLYWYYPNIWDVTKPTAPMSVREGFFDDKKLIRGIHKTLEYSDDVCDLIRWMRMIGLGYVVNFRPTAAKTIYELYAPKEDAKILDTSAGYGGRMLGAWASENVSEYVGMDPNTETYKNGLKLIDFLKDNYPNDFEAKLYCTGSEDFTVENYPQYKNYFDLMFTSPPYFNTEQYSKEETQSYMKFNKYDKWITGFYKPTLFNAIDCLKEDGTLGINIFEKTLNVKALTSFIAAHKGFLQYKQDKYLLRTMPGLGKKDINGVVQSRDLSAGANFEPLFLFKRADVLFEEGKIDEAALNSARSFAIKHCGSCPF